MNNPTPNHIHLLKIFFWLALALIFFTAATVIDGQALPDAPVPNLIPAASLLLKITKPTPEQLNNDRTLVIEDFTVRTLDICTTHLMLSRGRHEIILPSAIADHTASMAAYSEGVAALNWYASRQLRRHGHPKLARSLLIEDTAQDGFLAVRNLFLSPVPASTSLILGPSRRPPGKIF